MRTKPIKPHTQLLVIFSAIALGSFVVGLGGELYAHVRELPVLSSMRVSTRYFFITSFSLLVVLSILAVHAIKTNQLGKRTGVIIPAILLVACVQVFYTDYKLQHSAWINNPHLVTLRDTAQPHHPPVSEKLWRANSENHYYALTEATFSNKTQAIADNALVDTRSLPTQRCDEDEEKCGLVLSGNAKVIKWSPNRFTVVRTSPGEIKLNINQASHWKVNGQYVFKNQKIVNSDSTFTIPDGPSFRYTVEYGPAVRPFK